MTLLNNNNIIPNRVGGEGSAMMVELTGRQVLGDLTGRGIDMQHALQDRPAN